MAWLGRRMAWLLWQTRHSAWPMSSKIAFFGPEVKFCASRTWHCAHTLATSVTPGGVAPWLPWQVLHVGADVSRRFNSASACTLDDQSAKTVASRPNAFMRTG